MKNIAVLFSLIMILGTSIDNVYAKKRDWSSIPNPVFTPQKDVANNLDTYSHASGSIFYGGKAYVFINHDKSNIGNNNSIVLWKLTNGSAVTAIPTWKSNPDETTPDNLKNLGAGAWQPAPVVFNDMLYLFVKQNDKIRYSIYNQGADTWSALEDGPSECYPSCMAAVVVGDYLCLASIDASKDHLVIKYTRDMVNWGSCGTSFRVGKKSNPVVTDFIPISAIAKTYFDFDGKLTTKMIVGYIDDSKHARTAEFTLGAFPINSSVTMNILGGYVVSDDMAYSSIALAEGTVNGNKGICTQAFLKNAIADTFYARYRILRYTQRDGALSWSLSEDNIVTLNNPKMWADDYMNMTAINVPVIQANKDVRQYMCLIYRGYDDGNHPMNSAWAETDTYKFIKKLEADNADNERLKMYVGYVEGPPPYYLNPLSSNYPADPYTNNSGDHISEVTFVETDGSSSDKKLEYTVGLKVQFKIFGSKTEVNEEFGQAFNSVNELVVRKEYTWFPIKTSSPSENNSKGHYIVCKPRIHRADYMVTDVFGQELYKTYYFYNTGISETGETAELGGGLVAGNLETYFERPINWEGYDQFGNGDNSLTWYPGHEEDVSIEVTSSNSKSLTSKTELTIGGGIGEIFEIEGSGSFVYETSSTVSSGFEVKCTTKLNEPDADGIPDLTRLEYNLYWLLPSSDTSINWWVPDGLLQNQSPWCVTYDITHYEFSDGRSFAASPPGSPKGGQNTDNNPATKTSLTLNSLPDQENPLFTLSQNRPNPFTSSTEFRYHLGSDGISIEKSSVLKHVVMTIYDMTGTKVATLVDEYQAPGDYQIDWNPSGLKSGFYICSLIADSQRKVIKILKMD